MATLISPRAGIEYVDWYYFRIPLEVLNGDLEAQITNWFNSRNLNLWTVSTIMDKSPLLTWINQNCTGRFVKDGSGVWFEDKIDAIIFRIGISNFSTMFSQK